MFRIIEDIKSYEYFKNVLEESKKCFIEPILFNNNYHPALNQISVLYIKVYKKESFLIPITHIDAKSLIITHIYTHMTNYKGDIYVRDKKLCSYYFPFLVKQLNFRYLENIHLDIINYYYNKYDLNNINCLIPITKLLEYGDLVYESIEKYMDLDINETYDKGSIYFYNIEKQGIKFNKNLFSYFKLDNENYSIKNNIIYSYYNLFTTTKRPSNSFNNINFLALNKKDHSKNSFIPKNDYFLEIDISAYHPSLIANLIEYKFEEPEIHSHLAKLYNVDYNESKELTFKQLYGGIFPQYKNLEFFKKTQNFIDKLWNDFKLNKLKTKSGISISKDICENANPNKVLNYYLQELETSNNINILHDLFDYLKNKQTHIIMYVYDSFILDVKNEEINIVDIENIFNKYNLKIKYKIKSSLE